MCGVRGCAVFVCIIIAAACVCHTFLRMSWLLVQQLDSNFLVIVVAIGHVNHKDQSDAWLHMVSY